MKKYLFKTLLAIIAVSTIPILLGGIFTVFFRWNFFTSFSIGVWLVLPCAAVIVVRHMNRLKRELTQSENILSSLPLRIFVFDQAGHVLRSYNNDSEYSAKKNITEISKISDLPFDAGELDMVWRDVLDTFRSGIEKSRILSSEKRRFTCKILDRSFFNRAAVLYCSWDATPFYDAKSIQEQQERNYSTLYDAMAAGCIMTRPSGIVMRINRAGAEFLGIDRDSAVDVQCTQIFDPIFADGEFSLTEIFERLDNGGVHYEFHHGVSLMLRNGGKRPISFKAEVVRSKTGEAEIFLLLFKDCFSLEAERKAAKEKEAVLALALSLNEGGFFRVNPVTREVRCENGGDILWPQKDGRLIPASVWVHGSDRKFFEETRERLLSGEDKIWDCEYRSEYFGHTVWYRIRAILAHEDDDGQWIAASIQNISSLRESILSRDENAFMLRMIMKSLPCIFFIKDASNDYRYVMYSDKGYEIFGSSPETVIGKTDLEAFGMNDVSKTFREQDRAANNSNKATEGHSDVPDRSGKLRHFHTIEAAYPTGDGRKLIFGICFDETAENAMQKEMAQMQGFYRELLDRLPVAFLLKDADHDFRYVIWNRLLEQHTGYSAQQVIGKTDAEIEPYPGMRETFMKSDEKALNAGSPLEFEQCLPTASGKQYAYHVYKMMIRSGDRRYIVETGLDISKEKELAGEQSAAILRMNEQIANASIVNACLRRLTREHDFTLAVKNLLQSIACGMDADRCAIFTCSGNPLIAECKFEWVRNGIPPHKHKKELNLAAFPEWSKALNNHHVVKIDLRDTHDTNISERSLDFCKEESIQALLLCGFYMNDDLQGAICIDIVNGDHVFSESDIRLLSDTVSIFQLAQQRQHIIDEIVENAALQKKILDTIKFPVLLINTDFSVSHANPAALKMMNHTLEEALQRPCHETLCHHDAPLNNCSIRQCLKNGKDVTIDAVVNGVTYEINATPMFHHGKIVQVLESFIDMTEVNRSKELLRRTAVDARNAANAKSRFLATMSHELRTPLNSVIGFSEMLKLGGMSDTEKREAVESIYLSGKVLLQLINDVLDLSKLEAGRMQIVPEKTDLIAMLDEQRRIFEIRLRENRLTGTIDCPETLPYLYLDGLRIRQILLNLIGNAVKFTHKGGVTVSVVFSQEDTEYGKLVIMIRDTGIAPEYLDKVFEPFVQQEFNSSKERKQGTGLGLPICKRLVEQMGGTLTVQSVEGRGSCFTVNLPHIRCEKRNMETKKKSETIEIAEVHAKVLLVDDMQLNLKVLEHMTRKLGVETALASNGETALKLIPTFRPDIILTDVWMSEMNGDQLAKEIRKKNEWKHIVVIATTADTEFGNSEKSRLFDDILLKPIALENLQKILSRWIGGKRITGEHGK